MYVAWLWTSLAFRVARPRLFFRGAMRHVARGVGRAVWATAMSLLTDRLAETPGHAPLTQNKHWRARC